MPDSDVIDADLDMPEDGLTHAVGPDGQPVVVEVDPFDEATIEQVDKQLEEAIHRKPSTVMLIAALRNELDPTIARLGLEQETADEGDVHIGKKGKLKIVAAITGVGQSRATGTFHRLVNTHKPALVINLGFAGALHPDLITGDVLYFSCLLNGRGKVIRFSENIPRVITYRELRRNPKKTLLTLNQVVHDPKKKKRLYKRHRAGAIDMESFALAEAAAMRGVKMIVVRAISDTAYDKLPKQIETWVKPNGTPNTRAVLKHLIAHPWDFKTVMYLNKTSKLASRKLSDKILRIVTRATGDSKKR